MNNDEAEAVLWALGDPVVWEHNISYTGGEHWIGVRDQMEPRCFGFSILADASEDLGCDENGTPFEWKVEAELFETFESAEAVPPCIGAFVRDDRVLWEWNFPTRTLWEAQTICERAVMADDVAELDRLDAQRYPLRWWPCADPPFSCSTATQIVPGEEAASIERRGKIIGCFWVSRCQTDLSIDPFRRRHFNDSDGNPLRFLALYQVDTETINLYEHGREHLREHHCRASSTSPLRYETGAEAKAACERYYATGKWK